MKRLAIVDNPHKAVTVWGAVSALDPKEWIVLDYPVPPTQFQKRLSGGTNVNRGFEPQFVPADPDRLDRIIEVAKTSSDVYLCFDSTLSGEESAAFLTNALAPHIDFNNIHRVRFGLMTKKNIQRSFSKPTTSDFMASERSENKRVLERMMQYYINSCFENVVIRDSQVGLSGYYFLSKIISRYIERKNYKPAIKQYKVAFRAENGSLVHSKDILLKESATKLATTCVSWLSERHRKPNVSTRDIVVPPPDLYNMPMIVLECIQDTSTKMNNVIETVIGMYHEGLITNPYVDHKVPQAYSEDVVNYLKTNSTGLSFNKEVPSLYGIVPIDIRLDMNSVKQNYRAIYRKIWQRTLEAHGLPALYNEISVNFNVGERNEALTNEFSGKYRQLLKPGFLELFHKEKTDVAPDVLQDVVLVKEEENGTSYYTENTFLSDLLNEKTFDVFEINSGLQSLRSAGLLRSGVADLLIPTIRGHLIGSVVLKYLSFLSKRDWIENAVSITNQHKQEARSLFSKMWNEIESSFSLLEKHKFDCDERCKNCSSQLSIIFDREKEPYLICNKTSTTGCGSVFTIEVKENAVISVFVPRMTAHSCKKCDTLTMRCHGNSYGYFIRCDVCGNTQPYE